MGIGGTHTKIIQLGMDPKGFMKCDNYCFILIASRKLPTSSQHLHHCLILTLHFLINNLYYLLSILLTSQVNKAKISIQTK